MRGAPLRHSRARGAHIMRDLPPVEDFMSSSWLFMSSTISWDEATPSSSPPSTRPCSYVVGSNIVAPAIEFCAVAMLHARRKECLLAQEFGRLSFCCFAA